MADSTVEVKLKAHCFASFTIAGVPVELFVDTLSAQNAVVQIKSPKKIGALRVYQELPGFDEPPRPKLNDAGDGGPPSRRTA